MTDKLQDFLATIRPGPINDGNAIANLLAARWDEFAGDDGGMKPHKLLGRMEEIVWAPPMLSFAIERHGGTVMGSTRPMCNIGRSIWSKRRQP